MKRLIAFMFPPTPLGGGPETGGYRCLPRQREGPTLEISSGAEGIGSRPARLGCPSQGCKPRQIVVSFDLTEILYQFQ